MDINSLRERLTQLNRSTKKSDSLWKPKDEHNVRLTQDPKVDDPFQQIFFHNEIGDNMPIPCPKMNHGEECAICEFAEVLKAWKNTDGEDKPEKERKADFEIFKKIQAKARVYVAMVERGHEDEGAKWWGMTPAQATQVLDVCMDGDRLEEVGVDKDDSKNALKVLFDTKKGYDLSVSFAKPGEKGNSKTFTQVTIKGRIKPSPLAKDEATAKKIVESIKNLSDLFPKVPSSEVEKMFKKYLGNGSAEAKTDGGTEKYGGEKTKEVAKPANTKESAKLSGTRSIDEAFGDMLAEE